MANPFRSMKNANRAQAQILRRDTRSDFRVTRGGLDAIMANLATTQTGLGRKLTRANARSVDAMKALSARSDKRMGNIVSRGQTTIDNRYGTAIGADPNLLRATKRVATSQGKVNKGAVKAGKMTARGSNDAMDILATAAQTAADSGQYELAMALRDRQSADAETTAASKLALQSQRLDFRLGERAAENEAERNERYLQLQSRLSTGGTGGEGFASAAGMLQELAASGDTDLAGNVQALQVQYNLGPAQAAKLRQMAAALTGGQESGVPLAEAFGEEYGRSAAATINPAQEKALNSQVWTAFDPTQGLPDLSRALAIAGIEKDADGKWSNDGAEVSDEMMAAAVAYVQSTWTRIAASRGA